MRGSIAAATGILVYENAWAAPIMAAIDANADRLVGAGSVDSDELLTTVDATDEAGPRPPQRRHPMGLIKTGIKAAVAVKASLRSGSWKSPARCS